MVLPIMRLKGVLIRYGLDTEDPELGQLYKRNRLRGNQIGLIPALSDKVKSGLDGSDLAGEMDEIGFNL